MKLLSVLVITFVTTSAFAQKMPTCKITTLASAKACMNKVAEAHPSYEEPNEVLVSTRKDLMLKLLNGLDFLSDKKKVLASVEDAEYFGFMLQHTDEHNLFYYALPKGNAVRPVELYELNLADLNFVFKKPLPVSTFFLGADGRKFDIFEDLKEALADFEDAE